MRIAVCEDEKDQQEHIRNLIEEWESQTGNMASVDFFTSGEHFLTAWDAGNSFAIVFFDIHLAGLDGMKTAKKIRERDELLTIVFLTSRIEYVLQGYEVNAWRYLIKPVHPSELFLCLNKAKEMSDREQDVMIIHNNNRYYKVAYHTITYIESFGHYVDIHTTTTLHQMRAGISQLEEKLPNNFFRCHRSYIINISYVSEVTDKQVIVNGLAIPLSVKKRVELMSRLDQYNVR